MHLNPKDPPSREELVEIASEFPDFKLPVLPLFVDDFMADTAMLDARARGAYLSILMVLWRSDCRPIPNMKMLRRAAGVTKGFSTVWAEIGHHFIEDKSGFWNRRLTKEWRFAATNSIIKRQHGRLGGSAKALKYNNPPPSKATSKALAPQPQEEPNGSSIGQTQDEKPKPKTTRKKPSKPMPEKWVPDMNKARNLMAELDLNRSEMNYCFKRMEEHAHATDRRQVDWDRAYGSWVRKAVNDGEIGPGARSRKTGATAGSILPDV